MTIITARSRKQNSEFVRVTKSEPCKICGKPDWCSRTTDGAVAGCMRIEDGAFTTKDTDAGTAYYHRLIDDDGTGTGYVHPSHKRKSAPKPSRDWSPDAAKYATGTTDAVAYLAGELGVTWSSLAALQVGWTNTPSPCWTFPERDAAGKVIGIKRRMLDGKKIMFRGGSLGLTYADDWFKRPGPVLLVEGASDTAALIAAGCCVIGRPSNTGGVAHLVELLRNHPDREVIVIGEHDEKPDGRCPGRSGAISTATKLAEGLRRQVTWCMPPTLFKDAREWFTSQDRRHDVADEFIDGLTDLTVIEPPDVVEVEPYAEPSGDLVTLDAWRDKMKAVRLESIGTPGLYFDGSPTGAGKSHADRAAMIAAGKSLTMVPTHANARELVAELVADGIDAVAYPERTESTCKDIDAVAKVQAAGLTPGATVCRTCPHRDGCLYFEQMDAAKDADHAIATHQRFARSPGIATGKSYVAAHENSDDMIRPMVAFSKDDLVEVAEVIAEARFQAGKYGDLYLHGFLLTVEMWIEHLIECMDAAAETTHVMVRYENERPKNLQSRLWKAIRTAAEVTIKGDTLRAVIGLATGDLHSWAVQVDTVKGAGGTDKVIKSFVAIWQPPLPNSSPVWFADATGNAETISRLSERQVTDRTPAGRLERQVEPIQVTHDITRRTKPAKVAGWLRGVLASHPDATRVGIIGHKPHIDAMVRTKSDKFAATLLDDETRSKIHKAHHFGEGQDRASNDWMGCDLVIVLGTPRVGTDAIRRRLLRCGQAEAAKRDGRWVPRQYEARTEGGDQVIVTGRGYADAEWRTAHQDQVAAALIQAAGRGRGVLADGVPVVVISTEPTGMTVAEDRRIVPVTCPMQEAVAAVAKLLSERHDDDSHCCVNAKESLLGETQQRVGTAEVAAKIGKSASQVSRLLTAAAAAGLVIRSERRKGGWFMPQKAVSEPEFVPDTLGAEDQIGGEDATETVTISDFDAEVEVHTPDGVLEPPDLEPMGTWSSDSWTDEDWQEFKSVYTDFCSARGVAAQKL